LPHSIIKTWCINHIHGMPKRN